MTPSNGSQRPRRARRQFTAAVLVLLASVGWAQQASAHTIGAGPVTILAIDPDTPTTLYAGTSACLHGISSGATLDVAFSGHTQCSIERPRIQPPWPQS
jgi:hypothetical protein